MEKNGIPTHYIGADIEKGLMEVRKVTVPPLEFVLRYFTAGKMCIRDRYDILDLQFKGSSACYPAYRQNPGLECIAATGPWQPEAWFLKNGGSADTKRRLNNDYQRIITGKNKLTINQDYTMIRTE